MEGEGFVAEESALEFGLSLLHSLPALLSAGGCSLSSEQWVPPSPSCWRRRAASTAPFCCLTGRGHCRPQPADAQSRGVAANCCLLSKRRNLSEAVLFFPNQKPFEVVTFVVSGVKQRSSGCLWEAGWSAVMRDRWLTASHPCVSHRTSALFSEAGEAEKLRFLLCRQKKGGDIGNVSQGAP